MFKQNVKEQLQRKIWLNSAGFGLESVHRLKVLLFVAEI